MEGDVAPKTQKQAQSALLFLYQKVMGRELEFLDVARVTKLARLPVVLSRNEIERLLPEFAGQRRLMLQLMYGSGLRHKECRRLRVKDVVFDPGLIVVRNGKGDMLSSGLNALRDVGDESDGQSHVVRESSASTARKLVGATQHYEH